MIAFGILGVLGVFGEILKAVEDFPSLVLEGIVSAINGFFSAVSGMLNEVIVVLHTVAPLPNIPSIPVGPYLGWLNWLYPVGQAVDLMVGGITMYVGYLGVRYLLSLLRYGGSE